MKTIDETNYKTEIPKIAAVLPYGTKQEIVEETGETYTTVHNVWRGMSYKQNIIDAIVSRYNSLLKTLRPVKPS